MQGLAPRLERLVRHCAQQCVDRVASTESSDAIAPDNGFVGHHEISSLMASAFRGCGRGRVRKKPRVTSNV